jgi:hypothetical protein
MPIQDNALADSHDEVSIALHQNSERFLIVSIEIAVQKCAVGQVFARARYRSIEVTNHWVEVSRRHPEGPKRIMLPRAKIMP